MCEEGVKVYVFPPHLKAKRHERHSAKCWQRSSQWNGKVGKTSGSIYVLHFCSFEFFSVSTRNMYYLWNKAYSKWKKQASVVASSQFSKGVPAYLRSLHKAGQLCLSTEYHPQLSGPIIRKVSPFSLSMCPGLTTGSDHLTHRLPAVHILSHVLLSFSPGLQFLDQRQERLWDPWDSQGWKACLVWGPPFWPGAAGLPVNLCLLMPWPIIGAELLSTESVWRWQMWE